MNKQLLIYGLAVAVVAGSSVALAQGSGQGPQGVPPAAGQGKGPHGDPEMRAQRQERMREHLGLTDEQVEQMQAIRGSDATREEKREQLRAVLNDEQRAKMDQMREQHRAARQAGGKHYRASHQDPEAYTGGNGGKDEE
jgi:Spy/CpxP family protein refolding chaperone